MTVAAARPLRILHVIARLNVGGAAAQVLSLAAEQQRRGHDVLVVHGRLAHGEESMDYLASELGLPEEYVPELQRELSPRADTAAVRHVLRLLRSRQPDVLHTHAAKAGAVGRIAALVAAGARPKARVHTFHGHVLRGYFGARRERAFTLVERALARTSTALVAASEQIRDDLVALGVAPRGRFAVVPYGFRFPPPADRGEARAEIGVDEGTFVVGFVGRLTAIKRPQDLVRALARLREESIDAVLCFVGDGELRGEVELLADELGVRDRCRVMGFQRNLAPWYAAFDALSLASANEGTPGAAIEALAAGRPVVATRVGGLPAVVDEAETGFLVEVGDVDALADRLGRLARDPTLRAQLGTTGADRMPARYGLERMADEIELLYLGALA